MTRNEIISLLTYRRNASLKDLEVIRNRGASDETIAHLKGMIDGLQSAMYLLTDRTVPSRVRRESILSGKWPNPLTAHLEK